MNNKTISGMKCILYLFGLLALPVQAVSFDCAKAGTKVEKLICGDAALSKLDEELNAAYKAAVQDKTKAEAVKQAQKQWMKERNGCSDAACVKRVYEARLHGLSSAVVAHTPSDDGKSTTPIDWDRPGRNFELIEGKGVEVCEIYKKNLEALGNPNLACERKVSPEYEGLIKLPSWRKLDLFENRNLWAQVEKMGSGGVCHPDQLKLKDAPMDDQHAIDNLAKGYQEHTEEYHEEVYKLNVAEIDVNNDGKTELVLREHRGLCGERRSYRAIALFVLNEKGNTVDLQKSQQLFHKPCFNPKTIKPHKQVYAFGNGEMYDTFFYKDETYLDRWTWSGIWIYKISNGKTEAICRLN